MSKNQTALSQYHTLNDHLAVLGLVPDLAEVHGLLAGLLAAQVTDAKALWLEEILNEPLDLDNLLLRDAAQTLDQIYRQSASALDGMGEDFALILPDGDAPISERAQALVNWSAGFLYGLGLGGARVVALSEDAREGLEAISDTTRLDLESLVDAEETEQDLHDLAEFLWVAVMLIHTDLGLENKRQKKEEAEA